MYFYGADFLKAGKCGELQIISISANINENNLQSKVASDLCYAAQLVQSDLLRYCVNVSAQSYIHGFVDLYFKNGVLLRYALACAPLKEYTEIRFYGTRGTIFLLYERQYRKTAVHGIIRSGNYARNRNGKRM